MLKTLLASALLLLIFGNVKAQDSKKVLIVYYSQSGSTQQMAQSIYEGAKAVEGVIATILPVDKVQEELLLESDAIIIGSPVYNANIAPAVMEFINSWPFEGKPMKNKLGAAFSTGGGISIGEELVLQNLIHAMLIQGMIIAGGDETESAFGASGVTGEAPFDKKELDEIFLKKGYGLGKRVAELCKSFN